MPTRNVVLTQRQADLVDELVSSGRYQNASEVLRDGLRMVESRDAEERAKLKALREAAKIGIADMEAGRYRSFNTPAALRAHVENLAKEVIARRRRGV
ncbi:MAG: type II toxin-antitoxin system ParD family antitoxin [Rhodospirillales bacterium]|nr:type II toxin-antitoxin system ParD family antitoxin [Rhodospirillales bacterium]QQS14501.1 MAG: type II toxin-antitoxin system ParD family antitoxin [Rhodospirillales bacterium]